jgi:hypothetical protein
MRDYLGNEVQGAMEVIRALAPPPAPAPVAALGAPVPGKRSGGMVRGRGDGRSDSVSGVVLGRGRAMDAVAVSDGEYVIPADAVSALGRGSSDAGARKLDRMVEETRAGYRAHLGRIPGPRKGGKRKFLGGLFENKQDTEIVQPKWASELGGAGLEIFNNVLRKRKPEDSIANFDQNQLDAFGRMRGIATGDPGGVQKSIMQSRNAVGAQQGRVGGAQDYLAGVFGQGGWSDQLVDDSLADFDYQREKDVAAAARNRAGRGAFGERRAIAEDEESVASNLARAKLGSSLREQGLNQRMAAAQGMGNLARTSGDLANLGAGLATTQRDVQVGNAGLLNQVGSAFQDRGQKVLDEPYRRLDAMRGFMSGAPSATSTTSSPGLGQAILGTAMAAGGIGGGMFLRDGGEVRLGRGTGRSRVSLGNVALGRGGGVDRYAIGGALGGGAGSSAAFPPPEPDDGDLGDMYLPAVLGRSMAPTTARARLGFADGGEVRLGRPTKRRYAIGGQVVGPGIAMPAVSAPRWMMGGGDPAEGMAVDPVASMPPAKLAAMPRGGLSAGTMPQPIGGVLGRVVAPPAGAMPSAALGKPAMAPAIAATGPASTAALGVAPPMPRGGILGAPMAPQYSTVGTAGGAGAAAALGMMGGAPQPMPRGGLPAPQPVDEIAMKRARLGAINGGRGMPQLPAPVDMPMQRSPLLRGFADGGLMGEDEPEFPEPGWLGAKLGMRPLFRETIPDALGMNYQGPDEDGAGGRPNSLEMRYIKARPALGAVDAGESAPVAAKTSVADKVKAVLGSGTPKPKSRAPMADVERDRSGPIPVPASKPEQKQAAALGQPRFANNFMPEMKTGEAHNAPPAEVAATQGAAAESKSWKDRLGDAMTNPLTMAGLALLASDAPNLGQALGQAGLTAAKTVADRKRQEKEDARQAKEDAWTERKMGLDEQSLQATLGNQKLLAESRAADDRRADETLGLRRQEIADKKAYQDARLGQMNQGLDIRRQVEARLGKAGVVGASGDPTTKVALLKMREQLGTLMADPETDPASIEELQKRIAGLEALGGDAMTSLLPPGFNMDEEE